MDETTELMRQQLVDTRSQLNEKLVSLEQQVSNTVESTGSALNATVGAVQETVESVTSAVEAVVQSVTNAIDLRQQFRQHPWLILGGSVALGYLSVGFMERSEESSVVPQKHGASPMPGARNVEPAAPPSPRDDASEPRAISAANKAESTSFLWHQLSTAVTSALVGIVQDAATHVVPQVMQYLSQCNTAAKSSEHEVPVNVNRQRNGLSTPERFEACRTKGR